MDNKTGLESQLDFSNGVTCIQLDPKILKEAEEQMVKEMAPYANFMHDWRARSANSYRPFP